MRQVAGSSAHENILGVRDDVPEGSGNMTALWPLELADKCQESDDGLFVNQKPLKLRPPPKKLVPAKRKSPRKE